MSIRGTIAKNTVMNAAGRIWEAVASLIIIRFAVDAIGMEAFGLWAILGVFTGYVALLDLGIGSAYVKYIAEHAARDERDAMSAIVSTGFFFYLAFGAVLVAVLWPLLPFLAAFIESTGLVNASYREDVLFLFRWGLALFAGATCMSAFTSVLTGLQRMELSNLLGFAASIIKLVAVLLFLHYGYGVRGLLYANALSFVVFALGCVVVAFKLVPHLRVSPRRIERAAFGKLLHFGVRAQVARLANLVMFETDKIIAGYFGRGLGLVTVYEVGLNPANKMRQIPLLLLSALLPAASDLDARNAQDQLRRLYVTGTKYVAAVAAPLVLLTVATAGIFIRMWMGEGFDASAHVLRILALGYLANIMPGAGISIALGKNRPDLQMKAGILATVVNVALTIVLVLTIGFWGIPIATAISMFISWFWFNAAMTAVMGVPALALMRKTLLFPVLAALPGFLVCLAADLCLIQWQDFWTNAVLLAFCCILFALSYLGLIRWFAFFDAGDIRFFGETLRLDRLPGFSTWSRPMRGREEA